MPPKIALIWTYPRPVQMQGKRMKLLLFSVKKTTDTKIQSMPYHYQAYGLLIVSGIELPALLGASCALSELPICVEEGVVPANLVHAPLQENPLCVYNEHEFKYEIPAVARYYVANGERIIVEPLGDNWDQTLLYLYSNCLAVALFQRNLIPFHVSGVFVETNKVLLFAAPSRTGKSTTALILQQKGYAPFTDDTALLTVENGICYAQASYPMARLWQNTIAIQTVYNDNNKQYIYAELAKYGFSFHDHFVGEKVAVAGVVFLEEAGEEIKIQPLKALETMQLLGQNIYRGQWLNGMKKGKLQFEQLTSLANVLPAHQATRPENQPTFEEFADVIEQQIIKNY